jgi:low temperature requirement protein LtrA
VLVARILPTWFAERIEPTEDDQDLRVSTLELFFDLVFVFIVTQFTWLIAHDPLLGLIQTVVMLGFVWWIFAGYSWLTNVIPPERPARRVLVLCAMAGWLLVGLTVPEAFEEGSVWIAVGMLVVVLVHGLMYLQASGAFGPIFLANLAAVGAVFAAQFVPVEPWRYLMWGLAAVIVWSVPFFHSQRGLTLHPAHIVERHGLVVLVALGESVVAIAVGSRGLDIDADLLIAALLGLVIAACLWWSLFVHELPGAEHALAATTDSVQRVRKVLKGLSYSFVPVLLGILVLAAGVEHAVGHATSPLDLASSLLLSGGVALFLLGTAGLRASMPLPRPFGRVAFAAAVLALAPLGLVNAGIQLGAIAVVLVAGLAIEHRIQATTGVTALGITSGVPVSGSSMMRHGRSKTWCTISAVTISAGAPSATTAPSRIAMRCVA